MSLCLSEKDRVSFEAFFQEIESWELTLSRQSRKLKTIKPKLNNPLLINSVEIILTEINAQLITYRKVKQAKKNFDIIQQYNILSRKFMSIMENIGNVSDQIENDSDIYIENTLDLNSTKQDVNPSFLKETFTYKINKKPTKSSKKNSFCKGSKIKQISKTLNSTKVNKSLTEQYRTRGIEEQDSWDIRYQLQEIKSMMNQIKNEIKFHSHEDIESQIQKLQHSNKKMNLQLKTIKDDTQYIVGRIQKMKQQLQEEKKLQNQMIQEFENPKFSISGSKVKSKSIAESRKNQTTIQEQKIPYGRVSDWVRMRI